MDSLIETHSAEEVERALRLEAEAPIIGINCRDLQTFTVDTTLAARLGHLVPRSGSLVAESGIADRVQAAQARAWGADAILVGEALMRSPSVGQSTRMLADAPGGAFAALFGRSGRLFVKLCGISELQHVELAAELGADAIGLVFAPSHRQVSLDRARQLAKAINGPLVVGVFVNEPADAIAYLAEDIGLGAIQLSGDEPPELAAEVAEKTSLPVIKGLRLPSGAPDEALDEYALAGAALLLDTPSIDGRFGGTGQVGDWAQAGRMTRRWPIIVSGGLTPQNVSAALDSIHPAGVDVSSGIETNRAKDSAKMRDFLFQSRGASLA
jgi:phosphoribosylanthranilate isomerase